MYFMLYFICFYLLQLQRQKDVMGYNRAALTYLQRDYKSRHTFDFLDENADKPADDEKQRTTLGISFTFAPFYFH
ncbi:hypothetical protein MBANPS3_003466 [Mucor bainieri]